MTKNDLEYRGMPLLKKILYKHIDILNRQIRENKETLITRSPQFFIKPFTKGLL